MRSKTQPAAKSVAAKTRDEWLIGLRKMPVAQRVAAIERRLKTLPKTPTAANVSFRKQLLRLLDGSRLEAGMVSKADLHRENSPFVGFDFQTARVNFRPRIRD